MSGVEDAPPPGSNIFQKVAFYAPKPKEIVPILLKSFQEAPEDLSQIQIEDLIKCAEEAITNSDKELSLRILVTGKTGQGKSTLINGLLGARFAREGAGAARCTTEVEEFEKEINGVPVVVFDSPGLQDNTSNEEEYIRSMKKTCQKLSMVLYCTKMTNTRLTDDDKKAMKKLTQAFGQGFWSHAVFVLTFANMERVDRKDDRDINEPLKEPPMDDTAAWELLEKRRFEGRLKLWKKELHQFLIKEVKVNLSIANGVPVIPTGDHMPTRSNPTPLRLPDRDNWFQELWETCSFRVREHGLFLEINSHRMTAVDEGDDGGKQEMSACQGDDLPREILEKHLGKEVPPEPVLPNMGGSKREAQTLEKLETEEQNERPRSSKVKELQKRFQVQEKQSFLKPTKQRSSSLDESSSVSVSPRRESNKSISRRPQPPPKPHHLKPLQMQDQVERRPRSAAISIHHRNELESKLCEHFWQKCSLPLSQESTAHQESTKENIQFEDSSEKYEEAITTLDLQSDEIIVREEAPEEDETEIQSEDDHIQMCEGLNENTPCEDTLDENTKTALVEVGIEANAISMGFNGLLNQPIHITANFATEMSVNAVEKRFGHRIAEAFRAALKYMKKPGQWFIKLIKKNSQINKT